MQDKQNNNLSVWHKSLDLHTTRASCLLILKAGCILGLCYMLSTPA